MALKGKGTLKIKNKKNAKGIDVKSAKSLEKKKKKNSLKSKGPRNKLEEFYKLEIENEKKSRNTSLQLDLINDNYKDIKDISEQVQAQVLLYKLLLRIRILSQKILTASNKLPLLPYSLLYQKVVNPDKQKGSQQKIIIEGIKEKETQLKNDITQLLLELHNILKDSFLKCEINVNENNLGERNIIYDEENKNFYDQRTKMYKEATTKSEQKLFSLINTWFPYSKNMCLNFFDIMHKITKISSAKTLKTYEQSISSQINQAMLDLPSILKIAFPETLNHKVIGERIFEILHKNEEHFNLNKFIYDDEVYYKKFLLNAIQSLKDDQENSELLKSQKQLYKIKKKYDNTNKRIAKILSKEPFPKLVNFMLPEPQTQRNENAYNYMDNPDLVDVILSSLFQE